MNIHGRTDARIIIYLVGLRLIGSPILTLRSRPKEKPLRLCRAHVDTTMAHRRAKIIMPVGAMKRMAVVGKEGCPRNAGQFIIIGT